MVRAIFKLSILALLAQLSCASEKQQNTDPMLRGEFGRLLAGKNISGPVSFYTHQYKDKNIFLFGDTHESKEEACSCSEPQCIAIDKLLAQYFQTAKEKNDFFVESPFFPKGLSNDLNPTDNPGFLNDILQKFKTCLSYTGPKSPSPTSSSFYKECTAMYPQVRFHYSDIRQNALLQFYRLTYFLRHWQQYTNDPSSIKKIFMLLNFDLKFACNSLATRENIKAFLDLFIKSNNFHQDYTKFTGYPTSSKEFEKFMVEEYLAAYKDSGPHKISKQIESINNKTWKSAILNYYNQEIQNIASDDFINTQKQFCSIFETKYHYDLNNVNLNDSAFIALMGKIEFAYMLMSGKMVDLYLMARAMRYLEQSDSKNIIVYAGALHAAPLSTLFNSVGITGHEVGRFSSKRCLEP